jgi:hypothetical protein
MEPAQHRRHAIESVPKARNSEARHRSGESAAIQAQSRRDGTGINTKYYD